MRSFGRRAVEWGLLLVLVPVVLVIGRGMLEGWTSSSGPPPVTSAPKAVPAADRSRVAAVSINGTPFERTVVTLGAEDRVGDLRPALQRIPWWTRSLFPGESDVRSFESLQLHAGVAALVTWEFSGSRHRAKVALCIRGADRSRLLLMRSIGDLGPRAPAPLEDASAPAPGGWVPVASFDGDAGRCTLYEIGEEPESPMRWLRRLDENGWVLQARDGRRSLHLERGRRTMDVFWLAEDGVAMIRIAKDQGA